HVGDDLRDRKRVDTVWPALQKLGMAVLERLQASDAGRDRGADPIRLLRDLEPGIALGQPRRSDDEMREAVHPPRLLAVDELGRIEVLHLAGEVHGVSTRVELGDRAGA